MKFLLEIINSNYIVAHNMVKRLKEIYPDSHFGAIVQFHKPDEHILKYLTASKDVQYEFLHNRHEIVNQALREKIDFEVLREFENNSPEKSAWRYIFPDREWGNPFMHGVVSYKSFINQMNSRDNILRVASSLIKTYQKIFDEFKPDIFLPAMALGGMSVFFLEQFCQQRNIPYIVPAPVRILDLFSFASNAQLTFPQIDLIHRQLMNGDITLDLSEAEKLYKQLMGELEKSSYFDRNNPCFNIKKLDTFSSKFKFFIGTIKAIWCAFLRWKKQRGSLKDNPIRQKAYGLKVLFDNMLWALKHKYQNWQVLSQGFGKDLAPDQKYIFYPLHLNPEYSTQFMGKMWLDQVYLIELLAKSIPADWIVYVKEHPATLSYRTRPVDFYKKIARLPNVCFAPVEINSHDLIMNAQMVAIITGTAGWEAIQRGKPLLTFAENFWDVMGLSLRYTTIENLSRDIHDEIIRMDKITKEERKRRIIYYLAAVLKHSFRISYPEQFCYEPGSREQYELSGREAADALKKHLNYLQGIKENEQYSKSFV